MPTVDAGDVLAVYRINTTPAEAALARLNNQMKASAQAQEEMFGHIQQGLNKAGNAMLVTGGVGLTAVGYFTKAAMEAVEGESLFEVTFEKNAKAVRSWSEDLSREYGRNAYAVRQYAGTFASVFKPSLGIEKATEMSEGLTRLAYDIESYRNIPINDVITRLQSGMSGELEPMRRLGVDLSQVSLQAVAASMGINDFGSETDEATKRLVRYETIMRQTADAQGDVTRTADSPSNAIRRQREQWEQLRVELGQAFLPALQSLLGATEPFIGMLKRMSDAQRNAAAKFLLWGSVAALVVGGILKIAGSLLAFRANLALLTIARSADATALALHTRMLDANTLAAIRNGKASAWMPGMKGAGGAAKGAVSAAGNMAGGAAAYGGIRALLPKLLPMIASKSWIALIVLEIAGIAYYAFQFKKETHKGLKETKDALKFAAQRAGEFQTAQQHHLDAQAAGFANFQDLKDKAAAGDTRALATWKKIMGEAGAKTAAAGDEAAADKPLDQNKEMLLTAAQARSAAELNIYRLKREEARIEEGLAAATDTAAKKELEQQLAISQQKRRDAQDLLALQLKNITLLGAMAENSTEEKQNKRLVEQQLTAAFDLEAARRDEAIRDMESRYERERDQIAKTSDAFKTYSDLILNAYILKNRGFTDAMQTIIGLGGNYTLAGNGRPQQAGAGGAIAVQANITVGIDPQTGNLTPVVKKVVAGERQQAAQRLRMNK